MSNRFGDANDPRFWRMPKKERKVQVDERFSSLFTDKRFSVEAKSDKFGNKIAKDDRRGKASKELLRDYVLKKKKQKKKKKEEDDESSESEGEESSEVDERMEELEELGHFRYEPESTSEESSSGAEEQQDEIMAAMLAAEEELSDDVEGEAAPAELTEECSNKLGVKNLTWGRIEAVDLLTLFRGFCPPGGLVKRVAVYFTKEGQEAVKHEDECGPDIAYHSKEGIDPQDTLALAKVDAKNDRELRKHEAKVKGYYYAYVECDSKETALAVYKQCDGIELEATGDFLDLRAMPDDYVPKEQMREEASEVPEDYIPPSLYDGAGSHSNNQLTFDAEDPRRRDVLRRAPAKDEPLDYERYKEFLGDIPDQGYTTDEVVETSDSEVEGGKVFVKRKARDRYRSLLLEGGDMENERMPLDYFEDSGITFHSALSETGAKLLEEGNKKRHEGETREERKKRVKRESRNLRRQKKRDRAKLSNLDLKTSALDAKEAVAEAPAKKRRKKKRVVEAEETPRPLEEEETEAGRPRKRRKKAEGGEQEGVLSKRKKAHAKDKELAQLSLLTMGDETQGFNIQELTKKKKKKKKKRKSKHDEPEEEDSFKLNTEDSRFRDLYSHPDFALDPNSSKFKKTSAMEDLLLAARSSEKKGKPKKPQPKALSLVKSLSAKFKKRAARKSFKKPKLKA